MRETLILMRFLLLKYRQI